jgi:hypothetical protein
MGQQQEAFEATLSVLKLSPELETLLRDVAAGRTTLTPAAAAAAGIPEQAYEAVLRASEEHAAAAAAAGTTDPGDEHPAVEPESEQ